MWFFRSSQVIFGEDALTWLAQFEGRRAFIVTDPMIQELGYVQRVQEQLQIPGIESAVFAEVEPDPSLETARRCAEAMLKYQPDWVIGLGGGSCLDAAKAAWLLYERPDMDLEAVSPFEHYGLRSKARFITIPTTAGSGAEVTGGAVLKSVEEQRKLEMATYEVIPDYAIVDPSLTASMPPSLTADTGMDVLSHAVEGYTNTFANDFSDGLCLQAVRMVFEFLPLSFENAANQKAREKMVNAATIAGLGIGNSHIALAHALAHSTGAIFGIPHGRGTGLFLPYTVEYNANGGVGRYADLARQLNLDVSDDREAGLRFAGAIRRLLHQIGQPGTLEAAGISRSDLEQKLGLLCDRTEIDSAMATTLRFPYREEIELLYTYAFEGRSIDF